MLAFASVCQDELPAVRALDMRILKRPDALWDRCTYVLASTCSAAPTAELDRTADPHNEPEAEGHQRQQQVQDVVCTLAFEFAWNAALLAVTASLFSCHLLVLI